MTRPGVGAHEVPDSWDTAQPRAEHQPSRTEFSQELTVTTGEQPTIAKAVIAVVGALGTALATALSDGHVTVWEIVLGVLAAAGAGAAVWSVTNKRA